MSTKPKANLSQKTEPTNESFGDYLDMIEEIEQGYDDSFKWVDQNFINSIKTQIEEKNFLSDNQKQTIMNIYTAKK